MFPVSPADFRDEEILEGTLALVFTFAPLTATVCYCCADSRQYCRLGTTVLLRVAIPPGSRVMVYDITGKGKSPSRETRGNNSIGLWTQRRGIREERGPAVRPANSRIPKGMRRQCE
ncbi:hypothetical protein RRG08_052589 [Elysia crispata]|uniref:Uncharacterized protein n=1 Tax=Elysia crispata TaxID=231223 RepID=A0AAE1A317_9GAST|nr:hypothetical protein RRG08_052589 [Elysia crispata]